jgi:hypothetical protein
VITTEGNEVGVADLLVAVKALGHRR